MKEEEKKTKTPEEIKNQAEKIASETYYEDLACEILNGVEFKDEKAIAQAVVQLSDYLRKNQFSSLREVGEMKAVPEFLKSDFNIELTEKSELIHPELLKRIIVEYAEHCMVQAYHSQLSSPQEVTDEGVDKIARGIAERTVRAIKEQYDGLLRDAFKAGRECRHIGFYEEGAKTTNFIYNNYEHWIRSKLNK